MGSPSRPMGERLAGSVARPDAKGKRFVSALYELDAEGKRPPRRLTRSAPGESGAAFAPDGSLLFSSSRPDTRTPSPKTHAATERRSGGFLLAEARRTFWQALQAEWIPSP